MKTKKKRSEVSGINRRAFLITAAGTAAGAVLATSCVRNMHSADSIPDDSPKSNPYATKDNPLATKYNPYATGTDYSKIPQFSRKKAFKC